MKEDDRDHYSRVAHSVSYMMCAALKRGSETIVSVQLIQCHVVDMTLVCTEDQLLNASQQYSLLLAVMICTDKSLGVNRCRENSRV